MRLLGVGLERARGRTGSPRCPSTVTRADVARVLFPSLDDDVAIPSSAD